MISYQILKSATSVGANYRSACRGRSLAELVTKLNIAIEKADETFYWLELISATKNATDKTALQKLPRESYELKALFTASSKTIRTGTKN